MTITLLPTTRANWGVSLAFARGMFVLMLVNSENSAFEVWLLSKRVEKSNWHWLHSYSQALMR